MHGTVSSSPLLLVSIILTCHAISSVAVDDSETINHAHNMYGACVVATLRGLESEGQLNEDTIPDLECFLKRVASWGNWMKQMGCDESCYEKVVKGYGVRLFGSRTKDDRKKRRASKERAYIDYVHKLTHTERERGPFATYLLPDEKRKRAIENEDADDDNSNAKEVVEDREAEEKSWLDGASEADADFKDPSLNVAVAWKALKP